MGSNPGPSSPLSATLPLCYLAIVSLTTINLYYCTCKIYSICSTDRPKKSDVARAHVAEGEVGKMSKKLYAMQGPSKESSAMAKFMVTILDLF